MQIPRFSRVVIGLAVVLAAAPAWAVNKCTGQDGKVVFQDAPCDSMARSQEKLKLPDAPATTPEEARFNAAMATGKVMIGMTAEQVRRSWGAPTKVNASIGKYGRHEQWVYDRGNYQSQYVYVQNGLVTSIQSPQ